MTMQRWALRTAVTATAGLAMLAGITSPAYAANTNVDVEYSGHIRGSMTHIDDGDDFRVTDWYADGHGIEGTLQMYNPVILGWENLESKYNNVGAGNYVTFNYNVRESLSYRMVVCVQDGANDTTPIKCTRKEFNE
jgi:hypothetical protein